MSKFIERRTQPPSSPSLLERQRNYLAVRQHTLSTDGLEFNEAAKLEAEYVVGEALELLNAATDLLIANALGDARAKETAGEQLRHELADVVLASVTLASFWGWEIEDCILEKTEFDRGRG